MMGIKGKERGFTIVELLIIVTIIGILASITILAYNGVQNRAYDTAVQADLRNVGVQLERYMVETGAYPFQTQMTSAIMDIKMSKSSYMTNGGIYNALFCVISNGAVQKYVVYGRSKSDTVYTYSSSTGLTKVASLATTSADACSAAGISTADAGYWAQWGFNSGNSGTWQSWIKG